MKRLQNSIGKLFRRSSKAFAPGEGPSKEEFMKNLLLKASEKKKRLVRITLFAKPPHCFRGHKLGRIAIQFSHFVAISHKVFWISVIWQSVILRRKLMIKSMIIGLWLARQIKSYIEMPLSHMTGFIPGITQKCCDGNFRLLHVHG
mgnify:CR=1 FL=1